jgi:nucleoside-diphosphate-sugar epimerase
MSRILVTGGTGFVGRHLCRYLVEGGKSVRAAYRGSSGADSLSSMVELVSVGDIGPSTDWKAALDDVDAIIHLAGRVHVMQESATDPLAAFRTVNVYGSENLARQAAERGVRRLVYVSSVKVNGEHTEDRVPYVETDEPEPQDPYGQSKLEAERSLFGVANQSGIEVVAVRPPLVLGPGVSGNVLRLLKLIDKGFPLPFGRTGNQRSMIGVTNLCNFLVHCIDHPAASGQVFLVSDGKDLSTTALVRLMGKALAHRAMLFPLPARLVQILAKAAGQEALWLRLFGSLQVDIGKAKAQLGWEPIISSEEEIERMANWFRQACK